MAPRRQEEAVYTHIASLSVGGVHAQLLVNTREEGSMHREVVCVCVLLVLGLYIVVCVASCFAFGTATSV